MKMAKKINNILATLSDLINAFVGPAPQPVPIAFRVREDWFSMR